MRRAALAAAAAAAVAGLALPGAAIAAQDAVSIQFAAFAPPQLDVLPGETVTWTNTSQRLHTVNADDGAFASGNLSTANTFARRFDAVGAYTYHCIIHPSMTGEIDVRRVTLQPLPPAAVTPGAKVQVEGRTADPGEPVRIERADGASFAPVATATPAPDGTWSTSITATQTGDYRAANAHGASELRRLLVADRKIRIRATRRGVAVRVTPALPSGRVVLQRYQLERFGWWPQKTARLDYVSYATFRVKRRPARVRVVLVAADGVTPLVTSKVLRLKRRAR
jgi:plastocyanin